jgi:hypothetical protein
MNMTRPKIAGQPPEEKHLLYMSVDKLQNSAFGRPAAASAINTNCVFLEMMFQFSFELLGLKPFT